MKTKNPNGCLSGSVFCSWPGGDLPAGFGKFSGFNNQIIHAMAKKNNTTGRKSAVVIATKNVTGPKLLPKTIPAGEETVRKKPLAQAVATKKTGAEKKELPPMTTVVARVDVGWGNCVFVRGEGGGLSWEKGVPLVCYDGTEWVWISTAGDPVFTFKFLVNDIFWENGENHAVKRGGRHESSPQF